MVCEPDRLRHFYWSLRGMIRQRTLAFFATERRSALPSLDQAEIRFGGIDHQDVVVRLAALRGHAPDDYCRRLRGGHGVIYAAGRDGAPQSWGWITAPTSGPLDAPWEFGIRMRVAPGAGFLWDYFTTPACRGRGLYRALLRHAAEHCFRHGARQTWGYADIGNTASRRGITGAEYLAKAEIHLQRIGPLCRISRPGFRRLVPIGGVVELDALLQPGDHAINHREEWDG